MPLIPAALKEAGADFDEGEATPSTARELKALAADPAARRVAFPQNRDGPKLPLLPPAPPEADRSSSKPLAAEIVPAESSPGSNRSRGASKSLDMRRRTTSKGKVQVAVPGDVPRLSVEDSSIPGLPGVRESHVEEAFQQMDFDGNGFVGVSELRYLLTVVGEEPTDAELDEMLAMLGGEGDGQVAYEDFRMLFAPKSSVLAEMLSMAPQEPEDAKDNLAEEEDDEPDELPRLEAPAQQLGLLVKGAASFMQARIKKEDAGKKKASRARPKAKAPGSNRARPVLGPPRHLQQMMPGTGPAMGAMGPAGPMGSANAGTFRISSQPPPVPGHMSSMPPLPPGYLVGTEKMFQNQQGLGGAMGAAGAMGGGAMAAMGPAGAPGMPNQAGPHMGPGQQGHPAPAVDPLLQSRAKNFSANAPPKHLTFVEYQEMKLEHEVQEKLRKEAESDSD